MQSAIEYRILTVGATLKIGGIRNPLAVDTTFSIRGNIQEIEACMGLVSRIESIHFAFPLTQFLVEELGIRIGQLIHLKCVAETEKASIKAAVIAFLRNLLDSLPHHHLHEGQLGYASYQQQSEPVHRLLYALNKNFTYYEVIPKDAPLSLNLPPADYTRMELLPKGLAAFVKSIDDTDACKTRWENYFRTIDSAVLSDYLSSIITELRLFARLHYTEAQHINLKLERFVESLSRRTSHFNLNIMKEANKAAHSPIRPLRRRVQVTFSHTVDVMPIDVLDALSCLKIKLDSLYEKSGERFKQSFFIFKKSLSQIFNKEQRQPNEMARILTALQDHIQDKPLQNGDQQRVFDYINQCVYRLTQPIPQPVAVMFELLQSSYQHPKCTTRQNLKSEVLSSIIEHCQRYPEKKYSKCYSMFVEEASPTIKTLLAEKRNLFFCTRHRFKDAIDELKRSDLTFS